MPVADARLLEKVARGLSEPRVEAQGGAKCSILTVAAGSYGARPPADESTVPTGFDPRIAALFESIVEAAYLVATADGQFDDAEKRAFEQVVVVACGGAVEAQQIDNLLCDLADQLREDGLGRRILMVSRAITNREQQREVLRMAGLLANVSGGVSQVEREMLGKLAAAFDLAPDDVDAALAAAKASLA
jgi:tellurite resistance protein